MRTFTIARYMAVVAVAACLMAAMDVAGALELLVLACLILGPVVLVRRG